MTDTLHANLNTLARSNDSDFDFLFGSWIVHNRRLLHPLSGRDEWEQFEAKSLVRPIWDGRGHIEEWDAVTPRGELRAISLHLHDKAAGQWRLHWATAGDARVGLPTVGSFHGAVGTFYAQEEYQGAAVLLRITWEKKNADAVHWEQALSVDGGCNWELNWTMEFTRTESPHYGGSHSAKV